MSHTNALHRVLLARTIFKMTVIIDQSIASPSMFPILLLTVKELQHVRYY
jgi:hypothetical protein